MFFLNVRLRALRSAQPAHNMNTYFVLYNQSRAFLNFSDVDNVAQTMKGSSISNIAVYRFILLVKTASGQLFSLKICY